MMLCNVLILHRSLYGFVVLNIWWPLGLSIVMNVNCSHGEKNFLCKFFVSTFCLVPIRLKMLFYLFLNSQKFIVFIFNFFQSLKLIKHVFCYLTLVIGSTIFMNILIHHQPPITSI
jgi:hypothetical protein